MLLQLLAQGTPENIEKNLAQVIEANKDDSTLVGMLNKLDKDVDAYFTDLNENMRKVQELQLKAKSNGITTDEEFLKQYGKELAALKSEFNQKRPEIEKKQALILLGLFNQESDYEKIKAAIQKSLATGKPTPSTSIPVASGVQESGEEDAADNCDA